MAVYTCLYIKGISKWNIIIFNFRKYKADIEKFVQHLIAKDQSDQDRLSVLNIKVRDYFGPFLSS